MNSLDRFISLFSPVAGMRRARARFVIEQTEKLRKYDAAGSGRRWPDRNAGGDVSANIELEGSISKLRARSRELDRNNPYAKRAVELIADNVIGMGIKPTPIAKEMTGKLKAAWTTWSTTTECDFDRLLTFAGMQRLVTRTMAESGECIVRKRRTAENKSKIPYRLQVFEPDIIDTSRNIVRLTESRNKDGWIIQGVEFNSRGEKVGYWLWDRYPSDGIFGQTGMESKLVPVDDVIHVYSIDRPGQVHGVPFGVSAFLRLKDFDEFEDAELVRQKISACFSVFISESLDSAPPGNLSKLELTEKVEPGTIQRLSPGEEMTFTNPPTKDGLESYSRQVLRGIAAGYGVTYEALTGDLTNVNFSSGRMGWIEFQRKISHYQNNVMVPLFCDRVWDWFLDGASVGLVYSKKDIGVTWTPPRREMIDPSKEIAGMTAGIRAGLQDWGEAVTELGYDPETVLDRIERWNGEFDKRKIVLDSDPRKTEGKGKFQVLPVDPEAAAKPPKAKKEAKPAK